VNLAGLDALTLYAIAAMVAVTWGLRAAGVLVLARLPPTPFVRAFVGHLPGCLFAAFLAPAVAAGGWPALAGALAAAVAMARLASVPAAMAAGVGTVWLIRLAGG
jgi:uncharacterized membrane protein